MSRRSRNRLFNSKNASAKALLIRRLLIWSGIGIAALILLLVIAWYQAMAYLQGNSFRSTLEQLLTNKSGAAQITLRKNLHIDGDRISEDEIHLQGLQQLKEAEIARLSIEMDRGALLDRRLHIKKLLMEEASFDLYTEEKQKSSAPAKTASGDHKPSSAIPAKPQQTAPAITKKRTTPAPAKEESFFTLQSFLLDYVECNDLDVKYRSGQKEFSLAGSSIKATPISGSKNKHWQLNLENGRVHLPYSFLRDTSIRNAYITYNGRSIDVNECRFMLTPGEMGIKAHYNCHNHKWHSDFQINKADIDRLLKDDWKKRISGELFGKANMTGTKDGLTRMNGVFSLRQGILEGLPFLSELRIGNTRPYRTMRLAKADCRVSYPYNDEHRNLTNAWLIDKINVRAENGQLRIQGYVIIAQDKTLGGTLTFGIPQGTLAQLPLPAGVANNLFNAKGDAGYMWVNMNLSGTLENPEEDLSVRLTTVFQSALPEAAGKAASDILNTLFKTPSAAETDKDEKEESAETNIIQQATDSAGDLLKGGLRAFF